MDPISATTLAISAASAGMTALSSIEAGKAQAKAAARDAGAARYNADMARLQGKQAANEIRRNYLSTSARVDAVRAARGLGPSATGEAIHTRLSTDARRQQLQTRLGYDARVINYRNQQRGYEEAGGAALTAGYLGAGSALLDLAGYAHNSGRLFGGSAKSMPADGVQLTSRLRLY